MYFPLITTVKKTHDPNSWHVTCRLVILRACAQHRLFNSNEAQRGIGPRVVNLNSVAQTAQVSLRSQSVLFVEMSSKHTSATALCSTLLVSTPHARIYHTSAPSPLGNSFNMQIRRDWILIGRISVTTKPSLPTNSYWRQIKSNAQG